MKAYLAATFDRRDEIEQRAQQLRELTQDPWEVVSSWHNDDSHVTGSPIKNALIDLRDLRAADTLIFFSGSVSNRGARHVEFGIALEMGIPIFVFGESENVFQWLADWTQPLEKWEETYPLLHQFARGSRGWGRVRVGDTIRQIEDVERKVKEHGG